MQTKAEFGAQQFAEGYSNGCADKAELLAALKDARDMIINLTSARWSEYEGAPESAVAFIEAAIARAEGR